jgi:beta-glucosidase
MLTSWVKALCVTALSVSAVAAQSSALDAKADAIVAKFTVDDILGQMMQVDISSLMTNGTLDDDKLKSYAKLKVGSYLSSPFLFGSVNGKYAWSASDWRALLTRIQEVTMAENGGHPVIYGVDSVHGGVLVQNATLFGQQINAGASFNPTLVNKMGAITAKDTLSGGVPWVFGPILEISQNKLWARTFETFGEDPYLVSVMGSALIKGIQSKGEVAACMKHFVGYSKTPTGHDRDGVSMSDFELLNKFAPPFIAAVKAGVQTAMENYISINGEPVVASPKILRDLLRHDLGFEGFTVTDYNEIANLYAFHRVARSPAEAVRMSLTQTTVDMNMASFGTDFITHAKSMLKANPEYFERLKESARRVVKIKLALGLYDNAVPGKDYADTLGQAEDRKVALELARESIVLLQNKDNVLPIPAKSSIFLTGHSAHDIGNQCGGWTLRWQGYSGNEMYPNGMSIKQGLESLARQQQQQAQNPTSTVSYFNGLNVTGTYSAADLAKAKEMAAKADYTVVAIGEATYAEKPGDINDLALPDGQIEYVKQLASTGTKVVVVLVGGRPRLLNGLPSSVHAVINAMLPCEAGGLAIAEIIYGKVNPSGRMPITYPKDPANIDIPYNHLVNTQCASGFCEQQWEFGAGLSYTTFTYSDLKLSKATVTGPTDKLDVTVTVTNTGKMKGKETVMLFLTQPFRSLSVPEVKQLKKFEKIELAPGASATVTFTVDYNDWSVFKPQIGKGFARVAEDGDYVVAIKPETKCDPYGASLGSDLCARFTLKDNIVPFSLNAPEVMEGVTMASEPEAKVGARSVAK